MASRKLQPLAEEKAAAPAQTYDMKMINTRMAGTDGVCEGGGVGDLLASGGRQIKGILDGVSWVQLKNI